MRKSNSKSAFLLIIIAFIGCSNPPENNRECVVKKDSNGNVVSKEFYINDTILDSTSTYYFSNGNIHIIRNYKDGVKNGWSELYYENGNIKSKIFYQNGSREGIYYSYYQNGGVKEISNWLNNKPFGDAKYFFENGQIETYNCFDFQENNRYLIKYDSNGNKLKEEGTVLGQLLYETDLDSVPLLLPFNAKISVSSPPGSKVKVSVGELINSTLINIKEIKINNNIGIVERTFENEGYHILVSIGELIDRSGNVYKRDSIITEINVRK